nr:MAG TPA: hypothetical protein [Caudoviricetes sp.]
MKQRRRSATFDAILVFFDEPHVITLKSRGVRVLAVAVPDEDDTNQAKFLAVTVTDRDWERYLDGVVDLRYVFTYPKVRLLYTFDLNDMKNNAVLMDPFEDDIPESYLPLPQFFSSSHTEVYGGDETPADTEKLLIDGEWELTDFGQFQQKYSDVYTFVITTKNWGDETTPIKEKQRIESAFLGRPFAGGFSYVHLFKELGDSIPRYDKLNLNKINYASPGEIEVFGQDEVFHKIKELIPHFLSIRVEMDKDYAELKKFMTERGLSKLSGGEFGKDDPNAGYLRSEAKKLADKMGAPDFATVLKLSKDNSLVAAKVVLAFYRRLGDAAAYFAQGRVKYPG